MRCKGVDSNKESVKPEAVGGESKISSAELDRAKALSVACSVEVLGHR